MLDIRPLKELILVKEVKYYNVDNFSSPKCDTTAHIKSFYFLSKSVKYRDLEL